jgi:branched-chain amino acid transport system substrate-binding protein
VGNGAPSVDGVAGRIAFEKSHDIKGRPVVITRIPGVAASSAADSEAPDAESDGAARRTRGGR